MAEDGTVRDSAHQRAERIDPTPTPPSARRHPRECPHESANKARCGALRGGIGNILPSTGSSQKRNQRRWAPAGLGRVDGAPNLPYVTIPTGVIVPAFRVGEPPTQRAPGISHPK